MKKKLIWVALGLFIGINALLVLIDKDGKVDRVSYIKDWDIVKTEDMYVKIFTEGVLDYTNEENVYHNQNSGGFEEFLVEENELVTVGDPLYTYQVDNYYETATKLEQEVEVLNSAISAIEKAISKMKSNRIEQSTIHFVYPDQEDGKTVEIEMIQDSSEAEMIKEEFIIDMERELEQKKAEVVSLESQLTQHADSEDIITVESPYEGKVTKISVGMDNPYVIITAQDLHVTGELTEEERKKVEETMTVKMDITGIETDFTSSIHYVSEEPKTVSINKNSMYPFNVLFEEETDQEKLLPGYHASMEIITEESINTAVLTNDSLDGASVWKMLPTGKLVKQSITTGIHMDNLIEITKGVNKGDWIAETPKKQFRDGATFITPLNLYKIERKDINMKTDWKRDVVIGILSR